MKTFNDQILTNHMAILGKTGSGKTSTAKLAVEQVVRDGARVCILDTVKSDWWGITSSTNGKKPGLPFTILGGPRGHVPLRAIDGKLIGQIVGNGKLPHSIIDMADFEAGGIQRFFTDFAPALMKNMRGILYLVIEEAHELAPKERAGFGQENMAIHYAKKLATAGRSRGIRLIVATQRVQSLHNAVLGSCETLVAHRFTTPADQKPIVDWLKANAEKKQAETVAGSLSSLPTGTAWVCSGEMQIFEKVAMPRITTYDNSRTPDSNDPQNDVTTAAVDRDELAKMLQIKTADLEANDPKALQRKIIELERQLTQQHPTINRSEITAAREAGYAEGLAVGTQLAINNLTLAQRSIRETMDFLAGKEEAFTKAITLIQTAKKPTASAPLAKPRMPMPQPISTNGESVNLGKGERLTLVTIGGHHGGVSREQITVITGYKRSTRDSYLQRLRAAGLIQEHNGTFSITEAGVAALGHDYEPPVTGRALQERVMARLPGGEDKIMALLIRTYPAAITRDHITAETGYARSTRDSYLQRLSARKLIKIERGEVTASETLF